MQGRRRKNGFGFYVVLLLVTLWWGQTEFATAESLTTVPNVIVILSDDAGYADFGFTGRSAETRSGQLLVATPNLDRLAARGVVCTQAYVTASTCTPSRMGLMTGRYQQRFGAECNVPTIPTPGFTRNDLGLDTEQTTLGDAMRAVGYRTMAVGKWHLGERPQYQPNRRGFDAFYGFLGGSRSYWPLEQPRDAHAMRLDSEPIDEPKDIHYLTDDLTSAAISFIEQREAKPFFVYLAFNAVHSPFQAKDDDLEMVGQRDPRIRQTVAAMTKSMDDNVGRLLGCLEREEIAQDTLVIFLNDNGGTRGNAHDNGSLRGCKGTYWEGGIRVPMIVSWPARLPAGERYHAPVSALDVLPTCVAASGQVQKVGDEQLDGVNLLPYLAGERAVAPHDALFWRFWRVAAVRQGNWKLVRVATDPLATERSLLAPPILIDLLNDPTESTNLAELHPDRVTRMLALLEEWETELSPPRWYDGSRWKHWQEQQVVNHQMTVEGDQTD